MINEDDEYDDDTPIRVIKCENSLVILPNSFCLDHSMSAVTRSVLLDAFSRRNFEPTIEEIMEINQIGVDDAAKVLDEAEESGYLVRTHGECDAGLPMYNIVISMDKDVILEIKNSLEI